MRGRKTAARKQQPMGNKNSSEKEGVEHKNQQVDVRVWAESLPVANCKECKRLFWVECEEEAARKVLANCPKPSEEYSYEYNAMQESLQGDGKDVNEPYCFIMCPCGAVMMPFFSGYPWSGQWNAYSPFRDVPKPVHLKSVDHLTDTLKHINVKS